ncbi:MAG: Crp/Fnr family transcriptional regulator [Solirubrobacterales bacterium]|nr:Crp/Fnr family transcriptional regulator [Solirubrobacterales bacterium]
MATSNQATSTVRILDEDRELGARLSEQDLASARRLAVADVVELPKGSHNPGERFEGDGLLGLLMLDGLMVRQVAVAERRCGELVGPGAVLRPWDHFGEHAPLPFELSWRVIQPTRFAMLDGRFLTAIVKWPPLTAALVERLTERAQTLAFNVAIHCLQHVDVRLLAMFWHLADRFGRVTPAGTVVPLPLSHADLAELVGAARPSVSAALTELATKGLVQRSQTDRGWVLSREPPNELKDMRRARSLV